MKTLLLLIAFSSPVLAQSVGNWRDSSGVLVPKLPGQIVNIGASGEGVSAQTLADSTAAIRADFPEGGGTPRFSLAAHWSQSMTKTNIGANFVNIYSQTNADGKSVTIDTNGKDSVKLTVNWNKVGTGTQTVEIHDGANVLISMNVVSGFNTVTVAIPAAFQDRVANVRPRAKSTVAGDDPIAEGVGVYLK